MKTLKIIVSIIVIIAVLLNNLLNLAFYYDTHRSINLVAEFTGMLAGSSLTLLTIYGAYKVLELLVHKLIK